MDTPRTEPTNIELLIVRIIEIAAPHNDTEEEGMVYMPDEEEWGEIIGLARRGATELLDTMEKKLNDLPPANPAVGEKGAGK